MEDTPMKKPIFKHWWFGVGILVVVLFIIGSFLPEESTETNAPASVVESTSLSLSEVSTLDSTATETPKEVDTSTEPEETAETNIPTSVVESTSVSLSETSTPDSTTTETPEEVDTSTELKETEPPEEITLSSTPIQNTAPDNTPAPSAQTTEAPTVSTPDATPAAVMVYITNTGKKYHRSTCRYLNKSRIEISLENAKARGYDSCSVCNPPQ
jgi:hypothetical protein